MQGTGELQFPPWYDELAEFEHMNKGYLEGVVLHYSNKRYRLTFYEPVRLRQDAEVEIQHEGFWAVQNLIVLPSVTREAITTLVKKLCDQGVERLFVPDHEEEE
jgi:hypothetical protein